ncbi:MAG: DUF2934 domain-containing protein [Acidobacteria bacterium]|nr:DUF2934 domain-containing protein [Acidobacteriota bacterium]
MRRKKVVSIKRDPTWEEWLSASDPASGNGLNLGSLNDAIARLAYSFWEARGCQGGSAEEDWLRAEAEIQSRRR